MTAATDTRVGPPRHVLRVSDLTDIDLGYLLALAEHMKAHPRRYVKKHRGESIACYFTKPSTRTRVSLEGAAARLGMTPIMLRPDELQLGRGEPISDTARVLSGYVSAIAVRTFAQADVEELAANASVPVINALTDDHHPCQALADLLTLQEHFGRLEGLRLAYVGDGNNVATSLIEAGALTGLDVRIGAPPGYQPDDALVTANQRIARDHGGRVRVFSDPADAVAGADAVYTDVWVSMGDEAEQAARLAALEPYRVTRELMRHAAAHAVFMHCLPAHRGVEVEAEVIDGPHSVVVQQAHNRLPTEQALIHALVARRWPEDEED